MKIFSGLLAALLFVAGSSVAAKDVAFTLDQSVRSARPIPVKGIRILPSEYDLAGTEFHYAYGFGRPKISASVNPIAGQMRALFEAQTFNPAADSLTIVLHDFKFFLLDPMHCRLHADIFIGTRNRLRFLHSIDTLYQRRHNLFVANVEGKFVSECLIGSLERAANESRPSGPELTDDGALGYYQSVLNQFPLYTSKREGPCLFRAVDDFMHLRTVDTDLVFEHIPQIDGEGIDIFYRRNERGKKGKQVRSRDYFAAWNGKDYFLSYGGSFHKMIQLDGELYIEITAKMLTKADYSSLGIVGSLVGEALDAELDNGRERRRANAVVMGRFSPVKRTFIPSGGDRRSLRRAALDQ